MAELENGWYISSTDDPNLEYVTDNGNGKYTFEYEAGGKTYEITYVEDGKTGTTIYTPNTEECNPCYKETTFTGWAGPNSFSPFPSSGGTAKVIYNLGDCWEVRVVRNTKNATGVTTSQTSSSISVAKNETTAAIISEVEYEFKNIYVPTATKNETVKIYQQSKCSTDTECPEVSPTAKHIGKEESDVEVTFTEDCWILTDKYLTMDGQPVSDDVAKFTTNKIIHVYENKASNSRTIVAEYIFTNNALGRVCNRFVEITQEEGCNCSNVDYVEVVTAFTHEGGSAVIGNLTTCDRDKTSIEVKSGSSYITSGPTIGTPTNDVYPVSITVKSNETRDTTHHVKYIINFDDQPCKPNSTGTPPYDLIIEPKGCTCTCSQIHRTDIDTSYNYNTDAHNDVLLKELGIDTNFDCYDKLNVFKYNDVGITEIHYVTGGTIEIGGVTYTKLEIRGSLSELTGTNPKRTMRFGIKVCDEDCTELNPFYVYQRCSCGMDNCRNEYPLEGSTVYEDHPLYCNGCDQDWNGDAICVETLNLTKVNYYTRTFQDEAAIRKNRGTSSQKQTVYTGNVWLRNGTNKQSSNTLNPNYVGEDNKLIVHESQGQNMFGIYTNYSTVSDRYPLGTSLDYSIEAPSIDMTEQVWEITYVTTSDYITGGAENGDCALNTFVVTVYKAPTGWKYKSSQRDRNNKQQLIKCTEG